MPRLKGQVRDGLSLLYFQEGSALEIKKSCDLLLSLDMLYSHRYSDSFLKGDVDIYETRNRRVT